MLHIEMAGQKIVYKDLDDLRIKLAGLLQTLRLDRQAHDQKSRELRRQEKDILKMLGQNDAASEGASAVSGRGHVA